MGEYLTKEEIRKWRSSLERITLEEYAARLGKTIQEPKHDESLADSVVLRSLNSITDEEYIPRTEKIQTPLSKMSVRERELKTAAKEIKAAPVKEEKAELKQKEETAEISIENKNTAEAEKSVKTPAKAETAEKPKKSAQKTKTPKAEELEPAFTLKKALTPREQLVFDYFAANKNKIVYAKDLAEILELPRDYVYKYIKNLRGKLNEDVLQNAENGGYILKAQQ